MKPEIMSPVGDFTNLVAAIDSGADAVYFGVKDLNMRATAKNFELKELKKVVKTCHDNKVKAYLTLNSIVYDDELKKLEKIVTTAKKAGINGIICHDTSVISICKKEKVPIIISTQASISNFESVKYYKKLGAKRVVLARELSLKQITNIIKRIKKDNLKIEVEVFCHGAMCVSVSGRCFISQFQHGRSANRGDCIQPCRREYDLVDKETKQELTVGNNYILSPKDLCTIPFLDKLVKAGVDSLKIEGRVRPPEYVSATTKVYRNAVDAIEKKKFNAKLIKDSMATLDKVYHRGFSTGFFLGKPINEWTDKHGGKHKEKKSYVGKVIKYYPKISVAEIKVESSEFKIGDKLFIQGPTTGHIEQVADSIEIKNKKIKKAVKGKSIALKVNKKVRVNDKVYVVKKN